MRCRRPMTLASVLAIAAFALVAAGCGGSGSARVASVASSTTTRGSSSTNSSAQSALARFQTPLAYARCIRAHGVPNFPTPTARERSTSKPYAVRRPIPATRPPARRAIAAALCWGRASSRPTSVCGR